MRQERRRALRFPVLARNIEVRAQRRAIAYDRRRSISALSAASIVRYEASTAITRDRASAMQPVSLDAKGKEKGRGFHRAQLRKPSPWGFAGSGVAYSQRTGVSAWVSASFIPGLTSTYIFFMEAGSGISFGGDVKTPDRELSTGKRPPLVAIEFCELAC